MDQSSQKSQLKVRRMAQELSAIFKKSTHRLILLTCFDSNVCIFGCSNVCWCGTGLNQTIILISYLFSIINKNGFHRKKIVESTAS